METRYTAYVEQGDDGWWAATCPEVPPAIGQGRTPEEAIEDLESCIRFVLELQRDQAAMDAGPAARHLVLTSR